MVIACMADLLFWRPTGWPTAHSICRIRLENDLDKIRQIIFSCTTVVRT